MSERPPPTRTLVVALSLGLVASLLVIAFLLGRESARAPEAVSPGGVPTSATSEDESFADTERAQTRRWPKWADLEEWEDVEEPSLAAEPAGERIEQRADGTMLLSNRGIAAEPPDLASDSPAEPAGSAVTDYFLRLDAIQSQSGAGDPNTFAMGLIKAGMGGSTAGFDQLIADTGRMEEEIRLLVPPTPCEGYHEANLRALSESRVILENMKMAFAGGDFSGLSAIARQAGTLQVKARALQDLRKQLIANAAR